MKYYIKKTTIGKLKEKIEYCGYFGKHLTGTKVEWKSSPGDCVPFGSDTGARDRMRLIRSQERPSITQEFKYEIIRFEDDENER